MTHANTSPVRLLPTQATLDATALAAAVARAFEETRCRPTLVTVQPPRPIVTLDPGALPLQPVPARRRLYRVTVDVQFYVEQP